MRLFNRTLKILVFLASFFICDVFGEEAYYKNCKEEILSKNELTRLETDSEESEAGYCFTCWMRNQLSQKKSFKEVQIALHTEEFKEKLRKRIVGQVETKLYQIELVRACIQEDKKWFKSKGDWSVIQKTCEKHRESIESSIKENWYKMRHYLALRSAPSEMGKDAEFIQRSTTPRFFSDRDTWFESELAHVIDGFSDIPPLSNLEKKQVSEHYAEELSQTPLKLHTPQEFKAQLLEGSHSEIISLSFTERQNLKKQVKKIREKNKRNYLSIIGKAPIMGYMQTKNPSGAELDQAFSKMEKGLKKFSKEVKNPEINSDRLIVFKPLIEEILGTNKEYCHAAEAAKAQADKNDTIESILFLAGGLVAAIPCLAGGPSSLFVCAFLGVAVGIGGVKRAEEEYLDSFKQMLTGENFERIAELEERQKELFFERIFFPLAVFGGVSVTGKAVMLSRKSMMEAKKAVQGIRIKDILYFTPEELAEVNLKYLSKEQLRILSKRNIRSLSKERLNYELFNKLSSLQQSNLKSEQLVHIGLNKFSSKQLKNLGKEQVQAIDNKYIHSMKPKKLTGIAYNLSEEQLNAMTIDTYKHLSIRVFKPHQMKYLRNDQLIEMNDLYNISYDQIKNMKRESLEFLYSYFSKRKSIMRKGLETRKRFIEDLIVILAKEKA